MADPVSDTTAVAEAVIRGNDAGRYTVPSRATYPHQWNWDSALAALGWAELDAARAWTELETLMSGRDREGMVPHIAFRKTSDDRVDGSLRGLLTSIARPYARYLPGPRWWGRRYSVDGRRVSGITQPPIAATCARLLFERHPDERRARDLLVHLDGWHRVLLTQRDPHGLGEPTIVHPWETGRDNAVEWDGPLWRVPSEVHVLHRRDTHSVDAAERPTDEHYRRFLSLVRQGTRTGWDQAELARTNALRVLDPGFSAILARAAHDLEWLARQLGDDEIADRAAADADTVATALRRRVESDGLIRAVDLDADFTIEVTSAGSALVLLAPGLDQRTVTAVRDLVGGRGRLASPYGVRSLDRRHPSRSPRNYWRGPVWTNVTWLTALALDGYGEPAAAAALRAEMHEAVEAGGMREYFVPDSGRGLGARDFTWTAALYLRDARAAASSTQGLASIRTVST